MGVSYPVTLKSFRGGRVGAFFADVPQAITAGTNEAEALDRAQDALLVASFQLSLRWAAVARAEQGEARPASRRLAATRGDQAGDS